MLLLLKDLKQYIADQQIDGAIPQLVQECINRCSDADEVRNWSEWATAASETEVDWSQPLFVDDVHMQNEIGYEGFDNPFLGLILKSVARDIKVYENHQGLMGFYGITSSALERGIPLKARKRITKDIIQFINEHCDKEDAMQFIREIFSSAKQNREIAEHIREMIENNYYNLACGYIFIETKENIDETMDALEFIRISKTKNQYYQCYMYDHDSDSLSGMGPHLWKVLDAVKTEGLEQCNDIIIAKQVGKKVYYDDLQLGYAAAAIAKCKINRKDVMM